MGLNLGLNIGDDEDGGQLEIEEGTIGTTLREVPKNGPTDTVDRPVVFHVT